MIERSRYSRSDLARFIGVAAKTVAAWSKMPSFPAADSRDLFDGVEFFEWWVERKAPKAQREKIAKKLGVIVPDEEPKAAPDDFAARRQRAKALMEELKLEMEQKTVVRVTDLSQTIETLIRCLRSGCDALQRRFGQEAADILEQSISEAENEIGVLTP